MEASKIRYFVKDLKLMVKLGKNQHHNKNLEIFGSEYVHKLEGLFIIL